MTIRRLIYTSRVARSVRYADAEEIARQADIRNQRAGLTGLLLYTPSHFVQVLEGASDAVAGVLERIRRDARHSRLRIVDDRDVSAPEFTTWAMAARFSAAQAEELERLDVDAALALLRDARDATPTGS